MPTDPYAALRALLRADAARNTPKRRDLDEPQTRQPTKEPSR